MAKNDPPAQPDPVTLAAPYAYYDDQDALHFWNEGQTVADPAQIAELVARKAPLKD